MSIRGVKELKAFAVFLTMTGVIGGCDRVEVRNDTAKDVNRALSDSEYKKTGPCLSDNVRAILERPVVGIPAARRLSLYYGYCKYDHEKQEKWLKYAADRGDKQSLDELSEFAKILKN